MIAVLAASGCTVLGPDYEAPATKVAGSFVGGSATTGGLARSDQWWAALGDPVLNELIATGLAQNLDIEAALLRIKAAEANAERFGIARQLDGDVTGNARVGETNSVSTDNASLTGDAFFVFDIFGEYKRSREQSLAELEATEFDAVTVRLAFLADIVSSYVRLRYNQTAAEITRDTIRTRTRARDVTKERAAVNDATQFDVARAASLAASARADLPVFEAQARINAFRIATLLDVPTETVLAMTQGVRSIPAPKHDYAAGVPADLLRNRPDIRAAERRLAAATAALGVSEAQLYPSLRLNGTFSVGDTESWSFGPALLLPLLDRRERLSRRDIAMAEAKEAELVYRREILEAVEETQTALALTSARRQQVRAFLDAARNSDNAMNLSMRSFEAGAITLNDVLNAEETRLETRLDLVLAQSELAQAWTRLQVSLGGIPEFGT